MDNGPFIFVGMHEHACLGGLSYEMTSEVFPLPPDFFFWERERCRWVLIQRTWAWIWTSTLPPLDFFLFYALAENNARSKYCTYLSLLHPSLDRRWILPVNMLQKRGGRDGLTTKRGVECTFSCVPLRRFFVRMVNRVASCQKIKNKTSGPDKRPCI